MPDEVVVRAEKVDKPGWPRLEGWLELTHTWLRFRPTKSAASKAAIELPLARIEGARALKGFGSGKEILQVVYRDADEKRRTVKFERLSWAAWSNDVLRGTGRSEPNSFAAFERDIATIRMDPQASRITTVERVELLTRLAQLRKEGALSEEEFQTEKARILNS